MFSFTKTLLAVSAIAVILPHALGQTTTGNATEAQLEQKRIGACQTSIQVTNFDFAYNYDVGDTSPHFLIYTYDYNRTSICSTPSVDASG